MGTPEFEVLRTLDLRAPRTRIHVSSTSVPGLAKFSLHREMEDQTALRARVPCLCSELDPLDLFHLTFITARSSSDALSCRASL